MTAFRQCSILLLAIHCACGKSSGSPGEPSLDPEALRKLPAPQACLKLSQKLTSCNAAFAAALRSSFIARGHRPDEAAMLAAAFVRPPGKRECARQPAARIERILGCYSNDCGPLAACVLNQPAPARDTTRDALRCPSGASAYRSSTGQVRWCARPNGIIHGPWRSERGAGEFVDSVPTGRFQMRSPDRVETYAGGRIVEVDGRPVSDMESDDLDTAITLAKVARNTSGASTAALRTSFAGAIAPDLSACTDELRLRDRFPSGSVLLILDIGAGGAVTDASAQAYDEPLAGCLATKARSWRLPVVNPAASGTAWLILSVSTVYVKD